jgi:N-succinyldiaminopimelate aminotransferase
MPPLLSRLAGFAGGKAHMARLARRLDRYGTTIFAEITQLAVAAGAVNLGQGDPEVPTPPELLAEIPHHLDGPGTAYARTMGHPDLNLAISEHSQRFYGLSYDPEREVTVTVGASEGMMAAAMTFVDPGSEVIVFEPFYEFYRSAVEFAGGTVVPVPMLPPDFSLDLDRVRAAIGPRTRGIILNSPQNPTGKMLSREELSGLAALCVEHDLFAITDEVYEHLAFSRPHLPLAGFPGMRERTIRISSAGKTFSVTGWRIGWAYASPEVTRSFRIAKTALTFCAAAAFQPVVAQALRMPDSFFAERTAMYRERRDFMVAGLRKAGIPVLVPDGAMYVTADFGPLGVTDGVAFAKALPAAAGVAGIPISAFCVNKAPFASLLRITFCKPFETLEKGIEKFSAYAEKMAVKVG